MLYFTSSKGQLRGMDTLSGEVTVKIVFCLLSEKGSFRIDPFSEEF